MPRSGSPQWRKRKEPVLDHLWHASIQQAGGVHDDHGHYAELVYNGIETRARADEIKRALFRARRYVAGGISGYAIVERDGNGYRVRFRAINKLHAKQFMLDHYGDDPNKWPYSAKPGRPNYSTETFKEDGQ